MRGRSVGRRTVRRALEPKIRYSVHGGRPHITYGTFKAMKAYVRSKPSVAEPMAVRLEALEKLGVKVKKPLTERLDRVVYKMMVSEDKLTDKLLGVDLAEKSREHVPSGKMRASEAAAQLRHIGKMAKNK